MRSHARWGPALGAEPGGDPRSPPPAPAAAAPAETRAHRPRAQAYVAMLRMQERLYSHKFFRRAAKDWGRGSSHSTFLPKVPAL